MAGYIDRFYNEKRIHSSLGTIPRSSMNAWSMPSEVSTETDEDHAFGLQLRCAHRAAKRER